MLLILLQIMGKKPELDLLLIVIPTKCLEDTKKVELNLLEQLQMFKPIEQKIHFLREFDVFERKLR